MKVSAAGNTEVPAYLVLKDIATDIEVVDDEDKTQTWKVKVKGVLFSGASPLEVLGLVKMYETRGNEWHASDLEIEDFVKNFNS